MYLIHWPVPLNPTGNHPFIPTLPDGKRDVHHEWSLTQTWKQMEGLVKKGENFINYALSVPDYLPIHKLRIHLSGKVKSIGVSNFSQSKLEEILPTAELIPSVNQV